MKEVTIIGAGLTGLTIAYLLKRQGKDILVLEKEDRTGGAIHTHNEDGFVFEEGPNTGVVSNPEVAELFEMLGCEIETANESAERRLILKDNCWHPLPCDAVSFLKTPLFTTKDKIGIFFEPLRKKGNNPDESVASLASRRIGQSFVDYAVNPFISGIYAGDPETLITRYALPKLYNLEQQYGSFIRGSFKKSREKKTERDKKASKKVFSAKGGLGSVTDALSEKIGTENIICNARNIVVEKSHDTYTVNYTLNGQQELIQTETVITTSGAYSLPQILPFVGKREMEILSHLNYAKVIQVAITLKAGTLPDKYKSFGGLIPQKENRKLLGVLFPSYCFCGRAPKDSSTLAVYMGGIRHPELFDLSDHDIEDLVKAELEDLFGINPRSILFAKIFRHPYAIPQYEKSSGARFETIKKLERENPGLIIAGNIRDGIGMADRIKQAFKVVEDLQ